MAEGKKTVKKSHSTHDELSRHEFSAAIDRAVAEIVSQQPSGDFQARLRSRIAEEPAARPSFWRLPHPAQAAFHHWAAATAVLAIAILGVAMHSTRSHNNARAIVTVQPPAGAQPAMNAREVFALSQPPTVKHRGKSRPIVVAPVTHEPEVLVSKYELNAVLDLYEQRSATTIDTTRLSFTNLHATADISIPLIKIEPLVVPELFQPTGKS
jgi:hypothetical protein